MHLKSLVLKGFKSFADRSVMTFEPGIAAIVGPNGSGKSNISDAVLWVLGERNARNLRGQSMEDVIFSGSSARKPQGMAEVSLVLDNSDGTLPVEFSEVSLTRRMYRDGESEYLINGTVARRMDVLDILHDSGLGTGTHSIIGQGQLSSILQSKPEDLRMLIEEAAGVLKHKQRKEKSEKKLALMDAHLTRVQDIVSEVRRQMKPLERKAKHALEYKEASRQLSDLELQLAVDDLRVLRSQWADVESAEKEAEEAVALLVRDIGSKEQAANELQVQLQSFIAGTGAYTQQHSRAQSALAKIDSDIMLFHEKKRAAVDYLAEMQISLDNDLRSAEASRAQRAESEKSFEEAKRSDDTARAALHRAQEALESERRKQRSIQQEIDSLSHARRDALAELEEARSLLARTQESLSGNRARSQMLEEQQEELAVRVASAKSENEKAAFTEAELAALLGEAKSKQAASREESGLALQERDRARSLADEAREARSAAQAHLKGLEVAWKNRQAKNPLRSSGIELSEELGIESALLVSRLRVPEKLEGLFGHLLGGDIDSLVVEDRSQALRVARNLNDCPASGTLSILSLASGSKEAGKGNRSSLFASIEADERLVESLEQLLGDVVLLDDADEACRYAQAHPGVTCASPDGFVAWANGKVSRFKPRDGESGELADFRELEQARRAAEDAESKFQEASRIQGECEARLRDVQAEGLAISEELAKLNGQHQAARSELERTARELKSVESQAAKVEEQKRAIKAALEKAEPDAEAYGLKVRTLEAEIDDLKDRLDCKRAELSPVRAAADKAAADLSEAKIASAASGERLAYAKRMLEACERDIRKADEQAARARAGIERKRASLERIDPVVSLLSKLSELAEKRVCSLEERITEAQDRSDGLHRSINEARAVLRSAHEAHDAQAQRLANVRVEKSRLEMKVESAVSVIVKDCAVPLESAEGIVLSDEREAVEQKAEALRRRISGMGAINPDAVDEFERLKNRYDYLNSQLDDMLAARRSLSRIVGAIDARMRDDFAKTFHVVNANFQEAFSSLFPGGKGNLALIDPEDLENTGVEVNAQPSGKRILKMTLMSGGEKSLTALALLFAVHKTRATPFYILDEVEAALDDTNLRRLVAYLDTLRNTSQFIIITHQRRTMEMADVLYGVSMQADGVTKVMSQRLDNALRYAEG